MATKLSEIGAADMRAAMIDSQLRTNDVIDPAVVAAMGAVAREAHVPAALSGVAYMDRAIDLGGGRALNPPLVTGRLLVAAEIHPGQRVLLHPGIACGRCEFCLRGGDVLCAHYQLIGEHRDGTFAQFVSVPARNVLPLPDDWSFAEGAAIGVNHLTAWRMLVTQAQMQPWETVLIFGIGGGVSLAGLQLAKALGARCIVTSRHAGKLEQARALGADHVIDASREDIAKTVLAATGGRGVDVVFENVGEAVWPAAMKSLVRGGRLVTCGATSGDQPGADLRRLFIRQLRVIGSTLGTLSELHDLLAFCQRHGVRPVIEQTFALDQVHAALDRLESGEQFGKIALAID